MQIRGQLPISGPLSSVLFVANKSVVPGKARAWIAWVMGHRGHGESTEHTEKGWIPACTGILGWTIPPSAGIGV